jgi:hypothetical protein
MVKVDFREFLFYALCSRRSFGNELRRIPLPRLGLIGAIGGHSKDAPVPPFPAPRRVPRTLSVEKGQLENTVDDPEASASHCMKPNLEIACCMPKRSVPSGLGMRRIVRSPRMLHSRSCRSICEASRGAKTSSGETARGFPRHRTWMHTSITRKPSVGVRR